MTWTVGSFCTGYGGLERALESVLDTELAWYSEIDPSACAVMEARYPGVPGLRPPAPVELAARRVTVLG